MSGEPFFCALGVLGGIIETGGGDWSCYCLLVQHFRTRYRIQVFPKKWRLWCFGQSCRPGGFYKILFWLAGADGVHGVLIRVGAFQLLGLICQQLRSVCLSSYEMVLFRAAFSLAF